MNTIALPDAAATEALGSRLAGLAEPDDVITLEGGLGMGKTTLARGFLRAMGHAGEVPSPSFAIVQPYDGPAMRLPVVHADLYRIADPAELDEIGLDEMASGGVLLVEWPERAGRYSGEKTLALAFAADQGTGRMVTLKAGRDWARRLPA